MSFTKLAQDSYTQGFVNAIENMGLTSRQKVAAYSMEDIDPVTAAAVLGGGATLAGLGKMRYDMVAQEEEADIHRGRILSSLAGGLSGGALGAGVGGAITGKRMLNEAAVAAKELQAAGLPTNQGDAFMKGDKTHKAYKKIIDAAKQRAMKGAGTRAGLGLLLGGGLGALGAYQANEALRDMYFDKDERIKRKFLGRDDSTYRVS